MKSKIRLSRNITIQNETESSVSQVRFTFKQLIILSSTIFIITLSLMFIGASLLSDYIYQKRINEFKSNYLSIEKNMKILRAKINAIDSEILKIEEKDVAIRSYAGMPLIDQDIRKLGIGGSVLKPPVFSDNLLPQINEDLSILEMDIEKITRQVGLEMNSYNSIYKRVKEDVSRIAKIPSIRPVDGGYLNSRFGYRMDPIDNVKRFHHGCDFSVSIGTPVYAPADGVIKRAYYLGGFGNHIKLDHSGGYSTIFAHLSKINVKSGQEVRRGEIIGLTGNSGRSTAPHLHYEVHYYGEPENPLDYFFSGVNY
ncbi:MAG: M23 family metallopeptidase [Candidatus Neomarinimicrobiota bacterium]